MAVLSTQHREGVRNRIGDVIATDYGLSDTRLDVLYTQALAAPYGNALTATVVFALEELVGRASILLNSTGEYGQRQNEDLYRRRLEMLKEWRAKLEAEIKAGIEPSSDPQSWFGVSQTTGATMSTFSFGILTADEGD